MHIIIERRTKCDSLSPCDIFRLKPIPLREHIGLRHFWAGDFFQTINPLATFLYHLYTIIYHFTKMSILGFGRGPVCALFHGFSKKVSQRFFRPKIGFESISVTNVFFRVVSKVSGAIAKMDIYKCPKF